MDAAHQALAPLTDWLPPEVRPVLPAEAWWLVLLVLALLALLLAGRLLRALGHALGRALFRRRRPDWDAAVCGTPLEALAPAGGRTGPPAGLSVYHTPARLRLVVLAPGGK